MKIYLASSNLNKKREMQELFPEHKIVTPKDENIFFNPDENGKSFYENSIIKAKSLWNIIHCPVLADDSGICVDILNGKPGIYSARYAGPKHERGLESGEKISQEEQNEFLIEQTNFALEQFSSLSDIKKANPEQAFLNGERSAHYVCAMVLYMGNDRIFLAQETMEGSLVEKLEDARGNGGFGYDPLFYLPEYKKTAAELTAEQKNAISHRGKASRVIKNIVDSLSEFQISK